MNKLKHIFLTLFVSITIGGFFGCKKTPDMPPVKPLSYGGTLNIRQLRALYQGVNVHFTHDVSLFATVIMTDNYKTLYIRDSTGAISLRQLTAHGIFEGDSLRINLNGSTLDLSGTASSLQIDSVDVSPSPTNKVVKLAVGKQITPITVTISQLNQSVSTTTYPSPTGNFFVPNSIYDAQLVQINDLQFAFNTTYKNAYYITPNTGATYQSPAWILYDCGAFNNIALSLYTGTTDFQHQKIPYTKSGSIIAAVTFYNNALQLTPRSFADMNFNQPRCGVDTLTQTFNNPAFGSGVSISAALFPGWVTQREVGVSQYWQGTTNPTDNTNFPSMSVHYSTDARNVVWLISPPIENSPTKNINFQSLTNYNTGKNLIDVFVSTDYNGYNLGGVSGVQIGQKAHWTKITNAFNFTTASTSSAWSNLYAGTNSSTPVYLNTTNANALLSGYTGTFYVGFRYTGVKALADSSAGYGINNVTIRN